MRSIPLKQPTILWADDDPSEILLMRQLLQDIDTSYRILEAYNGKHVLEYLESAKHKGLLPCLIVLDINMPLLNGKEALAQIKQHSIYASIPIVVFTTSASLLDQQFCKHYNTEMLTKPVSFAALRQVMYKLQHLCEVAIKE